jgi:hypothetical protein
VRALSEVDCGMVDRIVEEVRRIREEHTAQFNYDVDAIFAELKRLEAESGRPRVSFGPRVVERPIDPAVTVPIVADAENR